MLATASRGHCDESASCKAIAFTGSYRLFAAGWLMMFVFVACTVAPCQDVSATTPQTTATPSSVSRVQIPQTHVYHHLFRYILHLESLRSDGEDNPFMKDIAERMLEMTPSDWASVQAEAHKCEADVAPIDAEAFALIASIKSKYPGGKVADVSQIPAPPDRLIALQRQRDVVIQRHIDNLQRAMDKPSFARLDNNLQTRFAPKIHAGVLSIPARSASELRQKQIVTGK